MYIYVLVCEHAKFFVGLTDDVDVCLKKQEDGLGDRWLVIHKPMQILYIYEGCNEIDENNMTMMYMSKHGIDNVRGGIYKAVKIGYRAMKFLEKELKISHSYYKTFVAIAIISYVLVLHAMVARCLLA